MTHYLTKTLRPLLVAATIAVGGVAVTSPSAEAQVQGNCPINSLCLYEDTGFRGDALREWLPGSARTFDLGRTDPYLLDKVSSYINNTRHTYCAFNTDENGFRSRLTLYGGKGGFRTAMPDRFADSIDFVAPCTAPRR